MLLCLFHEIKKMEKRAGSRDNKKSHIIQLHVRLAVRIDEQLNTGGLSGVGRRATGVAAVAAH